MTTIAAGLPALPAKQGGPMAMDGRHAGVNEMADAVYDAVRTFVGREVAAILPKVAALAEAHDAAQMLIAALEARLVDVQAQNVLLTERVASLEAQEPVAGPAGPAGRDGVDGLPGDKGDRGEAGPEGPQGVAGRDGRDGMPGPQGERGLDGAQGPRGGDGAPGVKGDPGEPGQAGVPGLEGPRGLQGEQGPLGPQGEMGQKGEAGRDGFSPENFEVRFDGVRTLTFGMDAGDVTYAHDIVVPWPRFRGVYKAGETYEHGDMVTSGGSMHFAHRDTEARPETSDDWQLCVKRGRDGKDGKDGDRGERGAPGPSGKDLTQIGPDGSRF